MRVVSALGKELLHTSFRLWQEEDAETAAAEKERQVRQSALQGIDVLCLASAVATLIASKCNCAIPLANFRIPTGKLATFTCIVWSACFCFQTLLGVICRNELQQLWCHTF